MNRIRQHLRIGSDASRFDKEIDEAILNRIRILTKNPDLTWSEMLQSASVTIETYLDTKAYRKIWLRIGENKVMHIEINFRKNILNIQDI